MIYQLMDKLYPNYMNYMIYIDLTNRKFYISVMIYVLTPMVSKKELEDMFDNYNTYSNKKLFEPSWYPDNLEFIKHRDEQIRRIFTKMAGFIKGSQPNNIYCVGKNSTGKTLVIKTLKNIVKKDFNKPNLDIHYMSCKLYNSWQGIFQSLAERHGCKISKGYSIGITAEKFYQQLDPDKEIIIILDEFDKLPKKSRSNLITLFSRTNELGIDDYPKQYLVIAGNDVSTIDELDWGRRDNTHTSAFSPELVEFSTYTTEQIKDIIETRFLKGMNEDNYTEPLLNYISAKIKNKLNGDMRMGLKSINQAIEILSSTNNKKLDKELFDRGMDKVVYQKIKSKLNIIDNEYTITLLYCISRWNNTGYTSSKKLVNNFKNLLENGQRTLNEVKEPTIYKHIKTLEKYEILQKRNSGVGNCKEVKIKKPFNSKIVRKACEQKLNELDLDIEQIYPKKKED